MDDVVDLRDALLDLLDLVGDVKHQSQQDASELRWRRKAHDMVTCRLDALGVPHPNAVEEERDLCTADLELSRLGWRLDRLDVRRG